MANNPTPKPVTKKHLARVERERNQRRILLIIAGVVFGIILGLVIYGVIDHFYLTMRRPVAVVNNERITLSEFQKTVRFTRWQHLQQFQNTLQIYQYFAGDETFGASLQQDLQRIAAQLDPNNAAALGSNVLNQMIEDRLIFQEAGRLGITASDEEIDEFIRAGLNYFPEGRPTPTITPTPFATSTFSPTQLALVTRTPTATPIEATPTPKAADEAKETSVTETLPAAQETLPEEAPLPTLEPEPTPTEYTLEGFQQEYNTYLEQLRQIGMTEADFRQYLRYQIVRQKLYDTITADVEVVVEQVWARHILVADEETAKKVLTRLSLGDEWTELAAEYSQDTSNAEKGGDLGWFPRGRMVVEFEEVAFPLEIAEISDPVETQFGFHIIQKLGHDNRPLTTLELQNLRQSTFDEWVSARRQTAEIIENDFWIDFVPTDPVLPQDISLPPM